MIETYLPFKHSTAFRLMAVARDQRLANIAHGQCLPPHWRTLYELTKLPDDVFEAKIADGSIHPEMQRKTALRVANIPEAEFEQVVESEKPPESRTATSSPMHIASAPSFNARSRPCGLHHAAMTRLCDNDGGAAATARAPQPRRLVQERGDIALMQALAAANMQPRRISADRDRVHGKVPCIGITRCPKQNTNESPKGDTTKPNISPCPVAPVLNPRQ
jgi:hypothetical protein